MVGSWIRQGVLEAYENWEGKDSVPMKIKELMMVLRIEVDKRYTPDADRKVAEMPKLPEGSVPLARETP